MKRVESYDLLTAEEVQAICGDDWKLICFAPILLSPGGDVRRYAYYFSTK